MSEPDNETPAGSGAEDGARAQMETRQAGNRGENTQETPCLPRNLTIDEEFNFYFQFTKPLVLDLHSEEDRSLASAWVRKLEQVPDSEAEKKLRLDYLKLLLFVAQRSRLTGIFKKQPPQGSLIPFPQGFTINDMGNLMIDQDESQASGGGDARGVPYSMEISNDLREFVAAQEIPNFGVQMYYAWSADEPIHKWGLFEEARFPPYVLEKIKLIREIHSDDKAGEVQGCKKKSKPHYIYEKSGRTKVKSPSEIEKGLTRNYQAYVGLMGNMSPSIRRNFVDDCETVSPDRRNRGHLLPSARPIPSAPLAAVMNEAPAFPAPVYYRNQGVSPDQTFYNPNEYKGFSERMEQETEAARGAAQERTDESTARNLPRHKHEECVSPAWSTAVKQTMIKRKLNFMCGEAQQVSNISERSGSPQICPPGHLVAQGPSTSQGLMADQYHMGNQPHFSGQAQMSGQCRTPGQAHAGGQGQLSTTGQITGQAQLNGQYQITGLSQMPGQGQMTVQSHVSGQGQNMAQTPGQGQMTAQTQMTVQTQTPVQGIMGVQGQSCSQSQTCSQTCGQGQMCSQGQNCSQTCGQNCSQTCGQSQLVCPSPPGAPLQLEDMQPLDWTEPRTHRSASPHASGRSKKHRSHYGESCGQVPLCTCISSPCTCPCARGAPQSHSKHHSHYSAACPQESMHLSGSCRQGHENHCHCKPEVPSGVDSSCKRRYYKNLKNCCMNEQRKGAKGYYMNNQKCEQSPDYESQGKGTKKKDGLFCFTLEELNSPHFKKILQKFKKTGMMEDFFKKESRGEPSQYNYATSITNGRPDAYYLPGYVCTPVRREDDPYYNFAISEPVHSSHASDTQEAQNETIPNPPQNSPNFGYSTPTCESSQQPPSNNPAQLRPPYAPQQLLSDSPAQLCPPYAPQQPPSDNPAQLSSACASQKPPSDNPAQHSPAYESSQQPPVTCSEPSNNSKGVSADNDLSQVTAVEVKDYQVQNLDVKHNATSVNSDYKEPVRLQPPQTPTHILPAVAQISPLKDQTTEVLYVEDKTPQMQNLDIKNTPPSVSLGLKNCQANLPVDKGLKNLNFPQMERKLSNQGLLQNSSSKAKPVNQPTITNPNHKETTDSCSAQQSALSGQSSVSSKSSRPVQFQQAYPQCSQQPQQASTQFSLQCDQEASFVPQNQTTPYPLHDTIDPSLGPFKHQQPLLTPNQLPAEPVVSSNQNNSFDLNNIASQNQQQNPNSRADTALSLPPAGNPQNNTQGNPQTETLSQSQYSQQCPYFNAPQKSPLICLATSIMTSSPITQVDCNPTPVDCNLIQVDCNTAQILCNPSKIEYRPPSVRGSSTPSCCLQSQGFRASEPPSSQRQPYNCKNKCRPEDSEEADYSDPNFIQDKKLKSSKLRLYLVQNLDNVEENESPQCRPTGFTQEERIFNCMSRYCEDEEELGYDLEDSSSNQFEHERRGHRRLYYKSPSKGRQRSPKASSPSSFYCERKTHGYQSGEQQSEDIESEMSDPQHGHGQQFYSNLPECGYDEDLEEDPNDCERPHGRRKKRPGANQSKYRYESDPNQCVRVPFQSCRDNNLEEVLEKHFDRRRRRHVYEHAMENQPATHKSYRKSHFLKQYRNELVDEC